MFCNSIGNTDARESLAMIRQHPASWAFPGSFKIICCSCKIHIYCKSAGTALVEAYVTSWTLLSETSGECDDTVTLNNTKRRSSLNPIMPVCALNSPKLCIIKFSFQLQKWLDDCRRDELYQALKMPNRRYALGGGSISDFLTICLVLLAEYQGRDCASQYFDPDLLLIKEHFKGCPNWTIINDHTKRLAV